MADICSAAQSVGHRNCQMAICVMHTLANLPRLARLRCIPLADFALCSRGTCERCSDDITRLDRNTDNQLSDEQSNNVVAEISQQKLFFFLLFVCDELARLSFILINAYTATVAPFVLSLSLIASL